MNSTHSAVDAPMPTPIPIPIPTPLLLPLRSIRESRWGPQQCLHMPRTIPKFSAAMKRQTRSVIRNSGGNPGAGDAPALDLLSLPGTFAFASAFSSAAAAPVSSLLPEDVPLDCSPLP